MFGISSLVKRITVESLQRSVTKTKSHTKLILENSPFVWYYAKIQVISLRNSCKIYSEENVSKQLCSHAIITFISPNNTHSDYYTLMSFIISLYVV